MSDSFVYNKNQDQSESGRNVTVPGRCVRGGDGNGISLHSYISIGLLYRLITIDNLLLITDLADRSAGQYALVHAVALLHWGLHTGTSSKQKPRCCEKEHPTGLYT